MIPHTVAVCLLLACAALARGPQARQQKEAGQPDPANPQAVIRVQSALVMVPVSVTDAAGQPVRTLRAADFAVEEDGRPQPIAQLGEPGKTPLELALLFDVSGSVHARFEFERHAASRFVREVLKPGDTVTIFTIGLTPIPVQARTTSVRQALSSLESIQPTRGATAFYDSLVAATHALHGAAAPGTRRVAIVLSDGEENNSENHSLSDALEELQQADCIFYSINPSGPSIRLNRISLKGQQAMERLASETGGAAFLPDTIENLDAIFGRIAAEIQAQYLLGYYAPSQGTDGAFRRIAVRLPKHPHLSVRARLGYYASRHGETKVSRK